MALKLVCKCGAAYHGNPTSRCPRCGDWIGVQRWRDEFTEEWVARMEEMYDTLEAIHDLDETYTQGAG